MRKLTDIISNMDQFNGLGPYSDEYKDGDEIDIQTDLPSSPDKATVTEGLERQLRNVLNLEDISDERKGSSMKTETGKVSNYGGFVLSFENFLAEKRGVNMPSNVQSYFGGIDDADEDEIIEEE